MVSSGQHLESDAALPAGKNISHSSVRQANPRTFRSSSAPENLLSLPLGQVIQLIIQVIGFIGEDSAMG
jgi:hypothetical protein